MERKREREWENKKNERKQEKNTNSKRETGRKRE